MLVADHTNLADCLFCSHFTDLLVSLLKKKAHDNTIGRRNCAASRATDSEIKTVNSDFAYLFYILRTTTTKKNPSAFFFVCVLFIYLFLIYDARY